MKLSMDTPKNWIKIALSEIATTEWGNTSLTKKTYVSSGVIAYSASGPDGFLPNAEWFGEGIVLSAIGAQCGKCFYCQGNWTAIKNTIVIQPLTSEINTRYLHHYLNDQRRWKLSGSGQPFITLKTCRENLIPLPPTNEQHRIVDKIEELFSELDKGVESLKTAQAQLNVYRQALLKHAFEGKLTAQWRTDNPDKLESADTLLKRIQQECLQRYEQQLTDWEANGKQGSKPKVPRALLQFTDEELTKLPTLPQSWKWVTLNHIQSYEKNSVKAGPFGSALKKEFYVQGGYKIYGQEQVIRGDAGYGDYFISETKFNELSSCAIKPLDVLISLVGTIGKVLIVPKNAEAGIINPRLVKISLNLPLYRPALFKAYFESAFLRSLYATKSQGTTMDILNLGMIQGLPYPLCSTFEQDEIMKVIDEKFFAIEQLELTLNFTLQQSEVLRQSILKKAFSGQLVPQDDSDEPASVLLARIQTEKAAQSTSKKARI